MEKDFNLFLNSSALFEKPLFSLKPKSSEGALCPANIFFTHSLKRRINSVGYKLLLCFSCHFNLKSHMKRNIKHIGVIFNLDPHYKEGSHWVALFISVKKGCICFFDSYGEKPDPQIQKFMDTVQRQGSDLGLSLHQHWIQKRHQYGNSECGMYSLYFIINMLKDKNVEYFQTQTIPDKAMVSMRKKYFNG